MFRASAYGDEGCVAPQMPSSSIRVTSRLIWFPLYGPGEFFCTRGTARTGPTRTGWAALVAHLILNSFFRASLFGTSKSTRASQRICLLECLDLAFLLGYFRSVLEKIRPGYYLGPQRPLSPGQRRSNLWCPIDTQAHVVGE